MPVAYQRNHGFSFHPTHGLLGPLLIYTGCSFRCLDPPTTPFQNNHHSLRSPPRPRYPCHLERPPTPTTPLKSWPSLYTTALSSHPTPLGPYPYESGAVVRPLIHTPLAATAPFLSFDSTFPLPHTSLSTTHHTQQQWLGMAACPPEQETARPFLPDKWPYWVRLLPPAATRVGC